MQNFRTYQLAKELYHACKNDIKLHGDARDQFLRASRSICLNLAEGSAKPTARDRKRFYFIALGSLREVQSIIDLENLNTLKLQYDKLGGYLFKLIKAC